MHHELQLPPEPASVGHARSFLADVCHDEGINRQTIGLAQLVMSEIVTNAILHADTVVDIRVGVAPGVLTGEVTDHDCDLPRLLNPPAGAEHGRGIAIVDTVTSSWGVRVHPGGKTVWFQLATTPPGAPANRPP